MGKRKPISKKIRFEVFKRDKFTCQYCGKSAPDVVLEIDHIHPVSKDGENDIMNLITSCFDCNRGKGARTLDDDTVVKKQRDQLKELQERKEQLEMMLEWRNGLKDIQNESVNAVAERFKEYTGYEVNEHGRITIKGWVNKYPLIDILDSIETSVDWYFFGKGETKENIEMAFNKIGGICKKKQLIKSGEYDNRFYYYNYTAKAMNNNFWYCNKDSLKEFIFSAVDDDDDFNDVKMCLNASKNWSQFRQNIEEVFGYTL